MLGQLIELLAIELLAIELLDLGDGCRAPSSPDGDERTVGHRGARRRASGR